MTLKKLLCFLQLKLMVKGIQIKKIMRTQIWKRVRTNKKSRMKVTMMIQ